MRSYTPTLRTTHLSLLLQHAVILHLDQELRDIFIASPSSLRSRVLPASALAVRPLNPPTFPTPPAPSSIPLHENLQNHTLDVHFAQILCEAKPAARRDAGR